MNDAPRPVPLSLGVLSIFNPGVQIGMLLAGFGSIFFWVIAIRADLSFLTFHGALEKVQGTVVSVQVENPAMRQSSRIRTIDYAYSAGGQPFRGTAFTTGVVVVAGQSVAVEYSRRSPRWSRIEGMRRDRYAPAAALVTVVALLGVLLVVASVRAGVRRIGLLRDGEITGRETLAPVLHDPADPARNEVLDGKVSGLALDEHGLWRGRPLAAWLSMLLPAFVIVMNARALWRHLR